MQNDFEELRKILESPDLIKGPWNTYVYDDHDGPPDCDDIGVQATSMIEPIYVENIFQMDWKDNSRISFNRKQAEATAKYISLVSPEILNELFLELDLLRVKR